MKLFMGIWIMLLSIVGIAFLVVQLIGWYISLNFALMPYVTLAILTGCFAYAGWVFIRPA